MPPECLPEPSVSTDSESVIWMLKRIKEVGGSQDDMLLVYLVQIRCRTELACPAWNGALTKKDIKVLESIQKTAVKIILGNKFSSYKAALEMLKIPTLESRRYKLCISFSKKTVKSKKFAPWFKLMEKQTRYGQKYSIPKTRTITYRKSPLIYLTEILNN